MPYEEQPSPDEVIAIEVRGPRWIQCGCRERLAYVKEATGATIILWCRKCKKYTQVFLGYPLEKE